VLKFLRRERTAVTADEDEAIRQLLAGELRQVDDLGHVRQVITRVGHRVRLPGFDEARVVPVRLDLEIDDLHLMTGVPRGRGDQFQPERLEPEVNLRPSGNLMNSEKFHKASVRARTGDGFIPLNLSGKQHLQNQ
jgi:hypothetical protein